MANDRIVLQRNERQHEIVIDAQGIDQIGFVRCRKRGFMHGADGVAIRRRFGADNEGHERLAPARNGEPRRNSSAFIGCLPARCNSRMRIAPSPQAMVSLSSSNVPGAPLPSPLVVRKHLHAHRRALAFQFEPRAGKWRQSATMIVHLAPGLAPVDARFILVDLAGVGDALRRLRRQRERAALQRADRAQHQVGAERASLSCNSPAVMSAPMATRSTPCRSDRYRAPLPSSSPSRRRPHRPPSSRD